MKKEEKSHTHVAKQVCQKCVDTPEAIRYLSAVHVYKLFQTQRRKLAIITVSGGNAVLVSVFTPKHVFHCNNAAKVP